MTDPRDAMKAGADALFGLINAIDGAGYSTEFQRNLSRAASALSLLRAALEAREEPAACGLTDAQIKGLAEQHLSYVFTSECAEVLTFARALLAASDAQALTWAPSTGVRRYIVEITTQKPVHKLDVLDALHRAHLALRTDIAVDEVPPDATVRAAMKEPPSSVSPLGPGEDEYLSWIKLMERQGIEGGMEQPADGAVPTEGAQR